MKMLGAQPRRSPSLLTDSSTSGTAFEPRSRRWELAVYVRNVGRQEYVTATWGPTGNLAISGRPGEPRHWGIQFTIRY